jgi:zinc protease
VGENVRRHQFRAYHLWLAALTLSAAVRAEHARGPDLYELATHHLDNGVAVQIAAGQGSPLVALHAWIGAGSADDPPAQAGLAHLVEHMLFKGSRQYGVGELAKVIEHGGGEVNAWTSPDQTVFHAVLRSRHLGAAIDVLADTLVGPRFEPDELARERSVILEEMRHSAGDPGKLLTRGLMATAFLEHPYRRPVIGSEATLGAISVRDVAEFYRRWYVAPNLTLVVVGDVEPEELRRRIALRFGSLPASRIPYRSFVEPAPRQVRAAALEYGPATPARGPQREAQAHLALAFHAPPLRDPDIAALDLAAVVLSQRGAAGTIASRRSAPAPALAGYVRALRDASLFVLGASAAPQGSGATLTSMLEAVRSLGEERSAFSTEEVERAQAVLEVERARQLETVQGRARAIGWYATMAGDARFEQTYADRLRRLRRSDVQSAVRRHVRADRAVITGLVPRSWRGRAAFAQSAATKVRKALPSVTSRPASDERRHVLPNGITLLLRRDPAARLVAMRAAWSGGVRLENEQTSGAAALLARVITRGCGKLRAAEVTARVDELGGGLEGVAGRNSFGVSAEWLAEGWRGGLELFADCLLEPRFDNVELTAARQQQLAELASQASRPGRAAYQLFLGALYGQHPYHRDVLGSERSLLSLGRNALRDFYREHFPAAGLTLVMVGDFDPDEALAAVRSRFAVAPRRKPAVAAVAPPSFEGRGAAEREVYEYLDSGDQAHLVLGFPGATVAGGDRFALEVIGALLGGQSGRLFLELRERQGLAYQVAVHVTEGIDPGYLAIHVACAPDKLERVHAVIRAELDRLLDGGVSAEELERARNYVIGAHEVAMQRRAAVATAMAFHEAYGLGWQSWREYADRVAAVGLPELTAAVRTYLRWDRAVTATVRPPAASPAAQKRSVRGGRRVSVPRGKARGSQP